MFILISIGFLLPFASKPPLRTLPTAILLSLSSELECFVAISYIIFLSSVHSSGILSSNFNQLNLLFPSLITDVLNLVSVMSISDIHRCVEPSLMLLEEAVCSDQRIGLTEFYQFSVSYCTPCPKLPVVLDVLRLPILAFQSPMISLTSFFGVRLEVAVILCKTGPFHHLWHL